MICSNDMSVGFTAPVSRFTFTSLFRLRTISVFFVPMKRLEGKYGR